jgi:hypothetical protein
MIKRGGELEILAIEFLELIFKELKYSVVRKRIQTSGSQDGYDNLVEIVNDKYLSKLIYSECKDYTSELNYTDAVIKLPQIATTHENIDLVLFISPKRNFTNIFEETRNKPFFESLINSQFKVSFLTPETDVEKYFSLYPEIYRKAYQKDAPSLTENERVEILKQFDKFIFSDKNLQKIVIDEQDKEQYIGNIKVDRYHIKRSVRENQKRESEFDYTISGKKTIFSVIKANNLGVVLLGNPGFGKTSELKRLAIKLWITRDRINIIPTYKILKNFTVNSSIEDFLPVSFKLIPNQIIIFDGIDEIENIIDFSNKLRNFIADNPTLFKEKKFKFILSCRTNIYNKFIKEISGFDICFLNEISFYNGLSFLNAKFDLNLFDNKLFDTYKNRDILENPFYLELIGNYFVKHNQILTNKSLLIEEFVNTRLNHDKLKKFSNDTEFDKEKIISYTQKIAFALESMQKPFLNATEIKKVASVDEISLAKNSFLEENISENWSFVLKNIQEYFVAKILAELSFEEIINLLKIDENTTKVHPTWYNVVTFLLNLISNEQYDSLIDWLLLNDFEILLNADSDRITEEIKTKVLNSYFTKNCIEDNLWINDVKGIATFSECSTNIEFLISNIKNLNIHRRARMSAIKLLSYMNVNEFFFEELKTIIINIITEKNADDENHIYLIQDAVMLTKSLNLNSDVAFFNKIIELLKEKDNKEIVSSIIYSVPIQSVIDNINYFLEILDKSIGNKKWNTISKYNSITSTKDNIFNLFTKISDGNILLKIYEFSIDRQKNYQFKDSLIKEFLPYIKEFFKNKLDYKENLIKLISNAVINDKAHYYEDSLLLSIVKSCGIEKQLFDLIINSIEGNSDRKHFLAEITTSSDFDVILKKYETGILNNEFIYQFRNVLSHRNILLSKDFEVYIESNSEHVFKDKISQDERNERDVFWKEHDQRNFDVLFDHNEITKQIIILYDYLDRNDLSFVDIDKFYHRYYDDFELQKRVTQNAKHLLYEILRDNYPLGKKLNRANVLNEIVKSKLNIIFKIVNNLPKGVKGKKIEISDYQKDFIKKWCDENTNSAKDYCKNHISKDELDYDKYYIFEAIYKFQKYFKFNLDEELLLDMLWLNLDQQGMNTEFLDGIVSKEKVNKRVLYNLENKKINPSSFNYHLKYCVKNKISIKGLDIDLKSKIYTFLDNGYYYYVGEIIDNFFKNDIFILKEFLNYSSKNNEALRFLYDCIISLLIKQSENDIAINFLINNCEELIKNKTYSEKEIVRKLIKLNYEFAFDKFYTLIKNQIDNNIKGEFEFRNDDWKSFTHSTAIDILIKLFELCLPIQNLEEFFGSHYSPLRISYDTLINICNSNNDKVCLQILKSLNQIDIAELKKQNVDLFYLNKLKNDVQDIFYNHKSQPYKITQVLKILDTNKYLFIN